VNDVSQHAPASREDEIDFIDLWWIIWDHKILVAATTTVCVLLALVMALTATPLYRASVVVTEVRESGLDSQAGLTGEVGGLASLAGLNLGMEHPERLAVLRSRHLVEEFVKSPDVLPLLVAGEKDERHKSLWLTVERFRKSVLDIKEDKFQGIKTVTMDWKDPAVAARWADEFVALANRLLRDKAIEDASRNVAFLNEQVGHAGTVELQNVMYRLIEQETRTLMLAKGRLEYAFTVVDPAVKAEVRVSPKRTLMVLSGAVIGGLLGCYIAWLRMRFAGHHRGRARAAAGR
jgi:LPS O-antigen subunit length determinant protein (WzzB/FepE family)